MLNCPLTGGQVVQLIMEYLPLGSLRDYLPKRKLGVPQCLLFAQQICQVSLSAFAVCDTHPFPLDLIIVLLLCANCIKCQGMLSCFKNFLCFFIHSYIVC